MSATQTVTPAASDAATAQLPNAINGMELRMVRIEDIVIPEERHKRRSRPGRDQLEGSIEQIGLDSPVLLSVNGDGKYRLTAGGGRLESVKSSGATEIHALIKVRDAKAEAATTAAENMARQNLSPAEEADAMELMIRAGDTPRRAAEKVGLSAKGGTMRMALVELPEEIRAAFHRDGLPPSLAGLVKQLYDGNHDIGLEIGALALKNPDEVAAALSNGPREFFRQLTWLHTRARLRGKPPFIKTFQRGSDNGRRIGWDPKDAGRIKLKGAAGKWFTALSKETKPGQSRPAILLSEEDLDQAAAVGVAYHSPGEHGTVWVHDRKWLTDHICDFVLPRMKAEAEKPSKDTPLDKLKKAVKGKVVLAKMTVEQLAPTLERRFKRDLQPKAHAANLDFGLALASKLAVKKLTREQALFFAHETLGRDTSGSGWYRSNDRGAQHIAECAARVMEDWINVETKELKNGKTKTTVIYLEGQAAEKRMWEYVRGAGTPEDILRRALQMHAAAAYFRRECGANGKEPMQRTPDNSTAAAALAKIVKPLIPMSVKRMEREIREYTASDQAEAMIDQAKADEAAKAAQGTTDGAPTSRRRSSGKESNALALIQAQPGITIPQLAAKLNVKQNYLYRALPALEQAGKIKKKGRGWHATGAVTAAQNDAQVAQAA